MLMGILIKWKGLGDTKMGEEEVGERKAESMA